MRRHGKVDERQYEIVQQLRGLGVAVAITSDLGKGFPDLVASCRGRNFLLEVKSGKIRDPEKVLTEDQVKFVTDWKAPVFIIWSATGALYAMGIASEGEKDCVMVLPSSFEETGKKGSLCQ